MRNKDGCYLLRPRPRSWHRILAEDVDRRLEIDPGRVFDDLMAAFERTVIERALIATGGCRYRAAKLLGIGRNTITRKISQLQIGGDSAVATSDSLTPFAPKELLKERV